MNGPMVINILCLILRVEAALLLPSALIGALDGDGSWIAFVVTIGILLLLSLTTLLVRPKTRVIYSRDGFVIVALAWILMSVFGALPAVFCGAIPSFVDSFFETVSGFTTTGSSILTDIEVLPRSVLFWRSFTHFIGGMGVLVFVLSILPLADDRSMHLMRAEVPGPSAGKLAPRLRATARILYGLYVALAALQCILLLLGGMPLFDSVVNTFATAGTGGFAIKNASIAAYDSAYLQWVITIFMILFGVNFNLYYLIMLGQIGRALRSEELRWYLSIIALSIGLITINIWDQYGAGGFLQASFQVASVISTTGFATADFNAWPELSRMILVILMFLGSCAGSTGGGIKTSRFIILIKSIGCEIHRILHPRAVTAIKLEDKPVAEDTLRGVQAFLSTYMVLMGASMLLVSLDGFDFETTTTAVVSCFNNIGPGLGMVGPTGNFSAFSIFSKLVLSANMLLGRLEIFPMLVLFSVPKNRLRGR